MIDKKTLVEKSVHDLKEGNEFTFGKCEEWFIFQFKSFYIQNKLGMVSYIPLSAIDTVYVKRDEQDEIEKSQAKIKKHAQDIIKQVEDNHKKAADSKIVFGKERDDIEEMIEKLIKTYADPETVWMKCLIKTLRILQKHLKEHE